MQPAPDLVVAGRFRLSRLIGRGGMGSVWLATHLGLDVPCAVKFIEGEGAHLPEAQNRFEREAKAAAQLRSPNVVQILDHGVWQGTPYIAMELLDGEDLGKRLARLGRLSPHELLPIVVQVGRALTKAHGLGVVHRDLKPDNVFLVPDDDREIAKVLDFGIAKAKSSGTGANTRTGALLGTPYYMSPEQAQGTRAVDARSDLWALAVIVFEALTGQRPFESEALGDLLMRIIVAPIPMPSQFASDLPPGVDAWWTRASQRDPAQRFQTAKELCDGLALAFGRSAGDAADLSVQVSRPLAPPPPPPAYVAAPKSVVDANTAAPTAHTNGDKRPGARRSGLAIGIAAALTALGAVGVGAAFATRDKRAEPGSVLSEEARVPRAPEVAAALSLAPVAAPAAAPLEVPASASAAPAAPVVSAAPDASAPWVAPATTAARSVAAKPAQAAAAPPHPARPPSKPVESPPPDTKKKPIDLGI